MNIQQLVRTSFPTIIIGEDASRARVLLRAVPFLVVIDRSSAAIGILSSSCLCGEEIINERMVNRSETAGDRTVLDTFELMKREGIDVLSVRNGQAFMGVVTHMDITGYFIKRLERYKTVLQAVGHDLRNSLGNIRGLNAILEKNVQRPDNIELLRLAKHSCDHAHNILQDLLLADRVDGGGYVLEMTELNAFIVDCITEMTGAVAAKDMGTKLDISGVAFHYSIDKAYFKRVVHNLISNAIKFSHPHDTISILTHSDGIQFRLEVTDRGIGIPVEKQPHVFDRFSASARAGTRGESSTGLGMFFSKICIEKLGGRLFFRSSEGVGTSFFVEFSSR